MPVDNHTFENIKNSLTPETYQILLERKAIESAPPDADALTIEHAEFTKLNLQRTSRIRRTYKISPELKQAVASIEQEQVWLVITEPWCGDSAQILPYIEKSAQLNPKITLRILLRDENPKIMDQYLTNGTRSIPKFIAFDKNGEELFQWGPRPKEAEKLLAGLKAEGLEKPQYLEKLHLWYGRNRGKAFEKELLHLIS
ncbi:MAG: thioredoxin family protein [Deferribacteres bacterium]|nr:thioredoxin family protein [Deferribacteres bacterium]